jgi:hypothetical protein
MTPSCTEVAHEPPAHPHRDQHAAALPGQVRQAADVAAVQPRRGAATAGADGGGDAGAAEDGDLMGSGQHLLNDEVSRHEG